MISNFSVGSALTCFSSNNSSSIIILLAHVRALVLFLSHSTSRRKLVSVCSLRRRATLSALCFKLGCLNHILLCNNIKSSRVFEPVLGTAKYSPGCQ